MRSGTPLTQLIEFSEGFPDGDISWQLLSARGTVIASGAVTPVADAASAVITVSAQQNTLDDDALSSPRELSWGYSIGGMSIVDRKRYRLEAFLPFGVSEDGVRRKLGLERHELPDDGIDLVGAYGRFRADVGADQLEAVAAEAGHEALTVGDAIEGYAAFELIPSLQLLIATKESSGTNQFQRAAIDWDSLARRMHDYIYDGYLAVDPQYDPTANYGSLLILTVHPDVITGASS